MLITNEAPTSTDGFDEFRYGANRVYCSGLFFMRGVQAGSDSLDRLALEFFQQGRLNFEEMFGSFTILLVRPEQPAVVFSDNSCMRGFFVGQTTISDDISQISTAEGVCSLDWRAVCRYVTLTRTFGDESLIDGIRVSHHLSYYTVSSDGVREMSKGIGGIEHPSSISDPVEFFTDIWKSIQEERIVCALTGGHDSRMVVALLSKSAGRPLPCVISGDHSSHEVRHASLAAAAGRHELTVVEVSRPLVDVSWLDDAFLRGHRYLGDYSSSGFRIGAFRQRLLDMGYSLLVDGNSGAAHKDHWYTQDFPFYWSRSTRIGRFYSLRMEPVVYQRYLGSRLRELYAAQRSEALDALRPLVKDLNTQSYDSFGWHVGWVATTQARTQIDRIVSYSPLQELELIRYSYHLPRRERMLNLFQRRMTSVGDPGMARVPTSHGTTASVEPRYVTRDVLVEAIRFATSLAGLVSRKVLGRNVMARPLLSWSIEEEVRGHARVTQALNWARASGVLTRDIGDGEIPFPLLGRIVNVWLLSQSLAGGAGHCDEG